MTDANVVSIRIKALTADAQREMTAFAAKMKSVGSDAAGAMRQAEAAALDLNDVFAGKGGGFAFTRDLDALRGSLDPAHAAMLRMRDLSADYATQRALVTAAQRAGELSDAEAARTLNLLAAKFQEASAAAEAFAVDRRAAMAAGPVVGGGVTAGIVAQMNDIGVMMAAGQNPLMLAIQQGSQLNQVWAQMGATGTSAFKAIGAGLLAMLSPMNLATIAAIAGGAALVQWAMSALGADEEAKTLAEDVDDLVELSREYVAAAKAANQSIDDLRAKYGALADEVRLAMQVTAEHQRQLAEMKVKDIVVKVGLDLPGSGITDIERRLAAARTSVGVQQAYGNLSGAPSDDTMQRYAAAQAAVASLAVQMDAYRATIADMAKQYGITEAQAERLVRAYEALEVAGPKGAKASAEAASALQAEMVKAFGSPEAAIAAMGDLMSMLSDIVESGADIAQTGDKTAAAYAGATDRIERMGDALKRVADLKKSSIDDLAMSKLERQFSGDAIGLAGAKAEMEFNAAYGNRKMPEGLADEVQRERQAYIERAVAIEKNRQAVEALNDAEAAGATDGTMLAQLQDQAQLRQLILKYGEDSVVVAMAHVAAEREVFAAQVEGWTEAKAISEDTAKALLDAWDAAEGLASVDIAGRIAAALGPASQLSEYLRQAAGWWGSVQGVLQRASEGGGWVGGIVSRLGLGGTALAPMVSPMPKARKDDWGVDMDGDGVPDAVQGSGTGRGRASGGGGRRGDSLASVQAEAKAIMAELDRDIATIQEKLRAGLIDQGAATEAIAGAKGQAANKLAEIIPQLAAFGDGGAAAVEEWRQALAGLSTDLGGIGSDLQDTLTEGFGEAFASFIKGSASAQEAMDAFADKVISRLADIAAEQAVSGLLQPLMAGLFAGIGGAGGGVTFEAKGDVFQAGRIVPFAKGGVPDLNRLPPLASRVNTLVDRPTLFPMQDGVGVMGEAGEEAIMPVSDGGVLAKVGGRETRLPLIRGAGGRLGVEVPDLVGNALRNITAHAMGGVPGRSVSGVAASSVTPAVRGGDVRQVVNIQTPPGMQAVQSQRPDGAGGSIVDVLFEMLDRRMAANMTTGRGATPAAMAAAFGLGRTPK